MHQISSVMFSKACEYGIKAVIYIAKKSLEGERVKIGEIVEHTSSPEAFTAKVLGTLTKQNIVNSHTGPYGGFDISSAQMKQTRIIDIVLAIDGDEIVERCVLGLEECNSSHPCPIHHKYTKIRKEIKHILHESNILELAQDLKKGNSILSL